LWQHAATGEQLAASGDRRPATGEQLAASGDRRPATGERQPATGDRRPATADRQPATINPCLLLPLPLAVAYLPPPVPRDRQAAAIR